ncbi:MAG: RES family NAD+ phosphorylase [Burkholderiaceae bacterium]
MLWRIAADTPAYEGHELGGEGAELSGGRWNRKGTPVVYSSTSRALACLETLVHLTQTPLPLNRYLVEIVVPRNVWDAATNFDAGQAVGWDAEPAGKVSLDWGTDWVKGARSVLARVPSVVVEEEFNVLVNPRHPDLSFVRARKVRRWLYDGRFAAGAHEAGDFWGTGRS